MTTRHTTIPGIVTALIVALALVGCTGSGTNERGEGPRPQLTTPYALPTGPKTAAVPPSTVNPATRAVCEFVYARDVETLYKARTQIAPFLDAPGVDSVVKARTGEYFAPLSENSRVRAKQLQDRYALAAQACLNAGVPR
jgi:hypothetical protein